MGDKEIQLMVEEAGVEARGSVRFAPVLYGCWGQWQATVAAGGQSRRHKLAPGSRRWVGKDIHVLATVDNSPSV